MTKRTITSTHESDKRIYCVVAATVQCPFTREGKTVAQPIGRQVAQAAHVVSKVRCAMFLHTILKMLKGNISIKELIRDLSASFSINRFCRPITTIVLEVRDSFELHHVFSLLQKEKIPVYEFCDTNQPDYGDPEDYVRTAIATEPVTRETVEGILDYLPLWGSVR